MHRTQTQFGQKTCQGNNGRVRAILSWIAEAHYEVRTAQSVVETRRHDF